MRSTLFSALFFVAGVVGLGTVDAKQPCTVPSCGAATCAADPGCAAPMGCSSCGNGCCANGRCGNGFGNGCRGNGCGGNGCGACGGYHFSRGYEGLDRHFNCGCNGSYKFPVPPLYTYHWPGLYSQQLMTDYHSPWRFPPIKPYSDEHLQPYPAGGADPNEALPPAPPMMSRTNPQPQPSEVQAADYATTSAKVLPGSAEAMSDKLKRASRYLP